MKILSSRRSLEPSNWVRTFERLFGLGRREFEEANPQKFKCSSGGGGGVPGGWWMLKFQMDQRIVCEQWMIKREYVSGQTETSLFPNKNQIENENVWRCLQCPVKQFQKSSAFLSEWGLLTGNSAAGELCYIKNNINHFFERFFALHSRLIGLIVNERK